MIHDALFSPSPDDVVYKTSAILPGMIFTSRNDHRSDCGSLSCVKLYWL